jgi:hypothetical protein
MHVDERALEVTNPGVSQPVNFGAAECVERSSWTSKTGRILSINSLEIFQPFSQTSVTSSAPAPSTMSAMRATVSAMLDSSFQVEQKWGLDRD